MMAFPVPFTIFGITFVTEEFTHKISMDTPILKVYISLKHDPFLTRVIMLVVNE